VLPCEIEFVEFPIYGLGREGLVRAEILDLDAAPPTTKYTRKLGQKYYELSDHLGNPRVIITDRLLSDVVNGTPGKYRSDIVGYSNQYPYGMEQPGRYMNGSGYRYGYNGMERDSAVTGGHHTTYFRQYDARLGRFWSTDPITHSWESPYAAMSGNPVAMVDPSGADPETGGGPKPGPSNETGDESQSRWADNSEEWERWRQWDGERYVEVERITQRYGDYDPQYDPQRWSPSQNAWVYSYPECYWGCDESQTAPAARKSGKVVKKAAAVRRLFAGATILPPPVRIPTPGVASPGGSSGTVGAPGFFEGMIPLWGSGRSALNNIQNGDYGWAALDVAMFVTDVFLVKSIVTGIGKMALKSIVGEEAKSVVEQGLKQTVGVAAAAKGATGFINPSEVRFTQNSIGAAFKNGQSIDDMARVLRGPGGADFARSFEPIRLVEHDGLLWTLDNRRLAVFSAGSQQVPFRMATQAEIAAEWASKFTTTAEQGWGQFITIRLPK